MTIGLLSIVGVAHEPCHLNTSTSQHLDISTPRHLNTSTSQHLDISTPRHLNTSTPRQARCPNCLTAFNQSLRSCLNF